MDFDGTGRNATKTIKLTERTKGRLDAHNRDSETLGGTIDRALDALEREQERFGFDDRAPDADDTGTLRMVDRGEVDAANLAWNTARKRPVEVDATPMPAPFVVETPEGTMHGDAEDVLIRGINGELYPCDSAVFAETYDLVDAPTAGTED